MADKKKPGKQIEGIAQLELEWEDKATNREKGKEMQQSGELICYHCGDECADDTIHIGDKLFCCNGCKTVFEILDTSDMCTYYDLEKNPGFSLKGRRQVQYAWLDDPEVQEKLIGFTDGKQTKVNFYLPQMHCAACVWLLENLYRLNEGIDASRVNFLKKEVFIKYDNSKTDLRTVVELLDSIGYAPAINMNDLEEKKPVVAERKFYYKLGLAGFAFGNIMLLSFPEYLGLDRSVDEAFFRFFGFLNIALSIPVVFYSGMDYLRSAWIGIKQRNLNIDVPISIGILTIFGRSVFDILTATGSGYLDSLSGLIFFLLLGKWFQQKTYHTIEFERDYKSYFPIAAICKVNGEEKPVVVDKLKSGDTIVVRNHELIPADGILLKGKADIDYSFVTGESELIRKSAGQKIFAGGRQYGEAIEITLTKKVSQSYLTQLWNDAAFKKEERLRASELADRIGEVFTYVVLTIAFLTLGFWLWKDPSIAIFAFSAVLIVACPCAVALSIPFTFGNVLRILARHHFYLKNTGVIESIQDIDHVVFDKTGTLTHGGMSSVHYEGVSLDEITEGAFRQLASQSTHPMSRLIAKSLQAPKQQITGFVEIAGQGVKSFFEGREMRLGSAEFVQGGSGTKGVHCSLDGKYLGVFVVDNVYRRGLKEFINWFGDRYKLSLISGDNDKEKVNLTELFPAGTSMYFDKAPAQKLEYIKTLQEKNGQKVLFFGDGLNDAGAIQKSNVGIVLTDKISNFTPASDGIIGTDQFDKIPVFIEYTRKSLRLVWYAYFIALMYNVIGIGFASSGNLSPLVAAVLMPISSISVVLFGVITSTVLARRMGLR
jgi:Cu+-exporting ATPase